jgi:NADH-quinone oxidoreductase subunit L
MAGSAFYGAFAHSSASAGHTADIAHAGDMVSIWDKDYFFGESLKVLPENDAVAAAHHVPSWVKLLPLVMGGLGIGLAFLVYIVRQGSAAKIVGQFGGLHKLFYNKWFFDEIYDRLVVRNAFALGRVFWMTGDRKIIDGMGPDGISSLSRRFGGVLSRFQTGYLFHYAFIMMIGLIGLISWFIYRANTGS